MFKAVTAASSTSSAMEATALLATPQTELTPEPVSPSSKKHARRAVSQPNVSFRFPSMANSLSNNSRMSRRPGGLAATASRAPRTSPATGARSPPQLRKPSAQASVASLTRKGVVRGDDAQSGSASRKAVSMPSQAPVVATRRQPPSLSKPINAKSPPKPQALQSAAMSSTLTRKAATSSFTSISSRPQTKPGPTRKAGVLASHPPSGSGTEGTIGNRGTPKVTETSSNGVKQRRTPAVSIPTRLAHNHERSSLTSKRVWR
ncbi:hypothetical protein V5O48_015758 [Marasmius crinis-equi]|uniref:Uncharacterized protein n=1 Tax=Marasmius crinis-equi TaxID=585013 RepID=A0ABR3ETL9_9AGAR